MAQPLLMRLKQRFPNSVIDVYAPPWVAPLLRRMPEVNEVIVNPFAHGEVRLRERWQAARQLRARAYDQALVLPNSLKSALLPFFAGIPERTGFVGEMRYGLLNDKHGKGNGRVNACRCGSANRAKRSTISGVANSSKAWVSLSSP